MTLIELAEIRENYLLKHWDYQCVYWDKFSYKILENCIYRKSHKFSNTTYNDITIMIDTETSKPEREYLSIYDDVIFDIQHTKLKWNDSYNEIASKKEFKEYGINFTGTRDIDLYYSELQSMYSWAIKEDVYNDIDAAYNLLQFMQNNMPEEPIKDNHIVIWTMTIALFNMTLATLYGRTPSELCNCITNILNTLEGDKTFMYIFNLSYDYVFLRKFLNRDFGYPVKQLNVKPHYPISLEYENGLVLKDALILAQRKLSKWAKDLNVKHQKAVGDWDYTKIRHQNTPITETELHYAEFDTLSGVECLDTLKNQLGKNIGTMPLTSTGILREKFKKVGAENHAREWFLKVCANWSQYQKQVKIYHGGFVHGNREHLGDIFTEEKNGLIKGYDFASSYPFVLFFKYPCEKFLEIKDKSIDFILKNSDKFAFMFKLIAVGVELKDPNYPMPFLQFSKANEHGYIINPVVDNGRILACDYIEIYLNEIDLAIITSQYKIDKNICVEVEAARKDYLPRWFTDTVFELFVEKTKLKGIDKVRYTIQKYMLNACYGLTCQRKDKKEIIEQESGEYIINEDIPPEEIFNKTVNKRSTILPYFIGCWCTSYAAYNLFTLGSYAGTWLYSDTDSCYGLNWNEQKVAKYNQECINFMRLRGYGGVEHNGRMYYLGVAETDEETQYTEFCYHGAKRYAGRCVEDGEIHITVAGVPKEKGAKVLKNDIKNFVDGMIFDGATTGKLTHTHIYVDDIYINEFGDEVGDSIDLSRCDYKLSQITYHSLQDYIKGETEITIDVAEDIDDLDLKI